MRRALKALEFKGKLALIIMTMTKKSKFVALAGCVFALAATHPVAHSKGVDQNQTLNSLDRVLPSGQPDQADPLNAGTNRWIHELPKSFLWGVATAAHQIEGGNTESDWWDWEQLPGKIKNGDRSGEACNHWNLMPLDVLLMKRVGVNSYRFSIEWAKIEPNEGQLNWEAITRYRSLLLLLSANGIRPLVTLHHFTLPRWVRAQGGWEWSEAPVRFSHFVDLVHRMIAPEVEDWVTFNEPMVHLLLGYQQGIAPPGKKGSFQDMIPPLRGLLKAHAAAYRVLHENAALNPNLKIRVGMAHHLRGFSPWRGWHPLDRLLAKTVNETFNWALPKALSTGRLKLKLPFLLDIDEMISDLQGTQDYLGINYYTRDLLAFDFESPEKMVIKPPAPEAKLNDLGWEIYPEGLEIILREAAKRFPGQTILITENGIADRDDSKRKDYLEAHLRVVSKVVHDGVGVEGYYYWSLMDNFEWSEGFAPRFGLYQMDYSTQRRTARGSALWLADLIREHRTPSAMQGKQQD
jgi:beta-glucosidase